MSNQIASRHDLESYQVPVVLTKQRGEDDQNVYSTISAWLHL